MKYVFRPKTINYVVASEKGISQSKLYDLQVKYRHLFEHQIRSVIDFHTLDTQIRSLEIPELKDFEYNFYHKFSSLSSRYNFLRNNFHVERLSPEDLMFLDVSPLVS